MKRVGFALLLASVALPAAAWQSDVVAQTATGGSVGNVTGGSVGNVAGGRGGRGGAGGAGGNASASTTVNVDPPAGGALGATAGGGGGHHDDGRAPDVFIPSIGGGGADCPVVGFGAGGSGLGGGGGFGPAWISSRCDHRKYAQLIYELTGDRQAALNYLASVEPDVQQWIAAKPVPPAPAPTPAATDWRSVRDAQCSAYSPAQRRRYPECRT